MRLPRKNWFAIVRRKFRRSPPCNETVTILRNDASGESFSAAAASDSQFLSKEGIAAITIQAHFRSHLPSESDPSLPIIPIINCEEFNFQTLEGTQSHAADDPMNNDIHSGPSNEQDNGTFSHIDLMQDDSHIHEGNQSVEPTGSNTDEPVDNIDSSNNARRAFRALRSLVKLQAVARGVCVRRQARIALHCMHALARLQVTVRARQLLTSCELKPKPHQS
nr:protein IQ-DOMAIN 31 [Ipomoea trifida]